MALIFLLIFTICFSEVLFPGRRGNWRPLAIFLQVDSLAIVAAAEALVAMAELRRA